MSGTKPLSERMRLTTAPDWADEVAGLENRLEAAEKILQTIVDMDGKMYEEQAWPIVEKLANDYFAGPKQEANGGDSGRDDATSESI